MSDPGGIIVAAAAGAEVLTRGKDSSRPGRVVIDSREAGPGDLFVGLPGETHDGGRFAGEALERGAWGVLVAVPWAQRIAESSADLTGEGSTGEGSTGWVLMADQPLDALQAMARGRRRELGCPVVGITGSTGKTSVKDACAALLPLRAHVSPENHNTEIGLPLAILAAPDDTEALVLEMAMRGSGQIAELCRIAEPDAGVITNIGPVHLELLGTVEEVAAGKAEILAGLRPGGTAIVPAVAPELEPHLAGVSGLLRFGEGGDVYARESSVTGGHTDAIVVTPAGEARFDFPFTEAHNLENALAAIAAGVSLGASLAEMGARAPRVVFSRWRGELVRLPGDSILINDCYNANPMSMHAALDHLASMDVAGHRIAVLGEMLELGAGEAGFHREIGEHARNRGVSHLIGVGALARSYAPDVWVGTADEAAEALREALGMGDAVLVKGSRAVGLERVAEKLGV